MLDQRSVRIEVVKHSISIRLMRRREYRDLVVLIRSSKSIKGKWPDVHSSNNNLTRRKTDRYLHIPLGLRVILTAMY
jgi:hypothetical protein